MTPQRTQALEKIGDAQGSVHDLAAKAEVSDAVIRGLVKSGALEAMTIQPDAPPPMPDPAFAPPRLSDQQTAAAAQFCTAISGGFQPFLLDGVTGSGKTEVYFEAIAECIRQGKQALVLLPEIALTEPMLRRFSARFGR